MEDNSDLLGDARTHWRIFQMTNVDGDTEGKLVDIASTDLPQTFYDRGKSYLLIGKLYESLAAYAKAIQLSTATSMIDTPLKSMDNVDIIRDKSPAYEWVRRLLLTGQAAKFPTYEAKGAVKRLASSGYKPIASPVVVVAGGCDVSVEQQMQGYRQLMLEAFRNFKGTIISGGTTAGISGLVGDVSQEYSNAIRAIGYVPRSTPTDVSIDRRYSEIRYTEGDSLSALEPLQYWTDIIASDIPPSEVKLVGVNGGTITATEYRIALALGAYVAVIKDSGGEAAKLLQDDDWRMSLRLVQLPADVMTIRAFIGWESPRLAPDIQETIAKAIHDHYRHIRRGNAHNQDPSMAEWDKLPEYLKESSRQQAGHIFEKLSQIGCTVHKITDRDIELITFTEGEVEIMAEMEHGRWNVERLLDGWMWSEIRDIMKKTSPYLAGWSELPNEVKEWDRELVRQIPEFLAKVGLEVHR